jgi:hypothetical protein
MSGLSEILITGFQASSARLDRMLTEMSGVHPSISSTEFGTSNSWAGIETKLNETKGICDATQATVARRFQAVTTALTESQLEARHDYQELMYQMSQISETLQDKLQEKLEEVRSLLSRVVVQEYRHQPDDAIPQAHPFTMALCQC